MGVAPTEPHRSSGIRAHARIVMSGKCWAGAGDAERGDKEEKKKRRTLVIKRTVPLLVSLRTEISVYFFDLEV